MLAVRFDIYSCFRLIILENFTCMFSGKTLCKIDPTVMANYNAGL